MHKAVTYFRRLILLGALLALCGPATSRGEDPSRLLSTQQRPSKDNAQASRPAVGATNAAQVGVSYSLDQEQFTLHEPINLNFSIENRLPQPVKLDLGFDRKTNFIITVKKPDGTSVRLQQPVRGGTGRVGSLSLQPGQTYTQRLLLNEWYDFPLPGKYELSVRLDSTIQTYEDRSAGEVSEFHTTLEIKARDVARLEQICASLVEQIYNFEAYKNPSEVLIGAALTLSYVKDPAAIPYMERAIVSRNIIDPVLFAGLERVGDEKAIQALTNLTKNRDRDIANLARGALARIKWRSKHNIQ